MEPCSILLILFVCFFLLVLIRDSILACDGHAFGVLNTLHGNPLCAMCQIRNDGTGKTYCAGQNIESFPTCFHTTPRPLLLRVFFFFFCTMGVVIGV